MTNMYDYNVNMCSTSLLVQSLTPFSIAKVIVHLTGDPGYL